MAHSLGISHLIVAVNKLELVDWSKDRYDQIVDRLTDFLLERVKFEPSQIEFLPISAMQGVNLTSAVPEDCPLKEWYDGDFLLD